jgi:hypothetical protein
MVVVDHEPHAWFLLQDARGYVLDVNCSHSIASFSVVLRLTADEVARIEAHGRQATHDLASAIQYSPTKYRSRYGEPALESGALAAIKEWQANQPAA